MDTYFYDAPMETGEMPLLPKLRWSANVNPCIPANGVKVGDTIHHTRTAASTLTGEVVSIKYCTNGVIQFTIKTESVLGNKYEDVLSYRPGELCEVVE